MSRYTVGAQVPLQFTVKDATGTLVNSATQTLAVTQPDGTSVSPTITNPSTGTYLAYFTPTQAGRHVWYATTTAPATVTTPDAFNVGAVTDGPLVGLADIREFLGSSTTTTDSQLVELALQCSDYAELSTGRVWRRTTFTESYDGGRESIVLAQTPVLSITSVVESGTTAPAGTWFTNAFGVLYRGTSQWRMNWLPGRQNVVVTYVAGPAAGIVPSGIIDGVKELVRHKWDPRRGGTNLPRQAGADSVWDPRLGFNIPRRVDECWAPYRAEL